MVEEYIAKYGGTASAISADVAEGYSVGEVLADAVKATHGTNNKKIIAYLHSGVTLPSVQGTVHFDSLGRNVSPTAAGFIFQWQNGSYNQVLPASATGSHKIIYPKPNWGS
jgi:ABC-type branched-subunit amino acid transport system substrate-binding protein